MSAELHHKRLRSLICAMRQVLPIQVLPIQGLPIQGFDAGASSIAKITDTSIALLQPLSLHLSFNKVEISLNSFSIWVDAR